MDKRDVEEVVMATLDLQTTVSSGSEVSVQALAHAGQPIAAAFLNATTPIAVARTDERRLCSVGVPCVVLEHSTTGLPDALALRGIEVTHQWVTFGALNIAVWRLAFDKHTADRRAARNVRVCLSRVHAEVEALQLVFRAVAGGQLNPPPRSAEAQQLQDFLRSRIKLLRNLAKQVRTIGDESMSVAVEQHMQHVLGGVQELIPRLEAALKRIDVRPNLASNAIALATQGITVSINNSFNNSQLANVNIGSSLDQVVQTVTQSPSIPDDDKRRIDAELVTFRAALTQLEASHAAEAEFIAKRLEELVKQASLPKPQRNSAIERISADGLVQAATSVGKLIPTLVAAAKSIASLITGAPIP